MSDTRAGREGANLTVGKPVRMTNDLTPLTNAIASIEGPILFFNVGSAWNTGDSFGPILGSMLRENNVKRYDVAVMGTEDEHIGAFELPRQIEHAKAHHSHRTVIATDSAIGETVGRYSWEQGMLSPGGGLKKSLPPIGDYCLMVAVCAIVEEEDSRDTFRRMMECDRNVVEGYAQRACEAIVLGLKLRYSWISERAVYA